MKKKRKNLADEPEMKELLRQVEQGKIDAERLKNHIRKEQNHDRADDNESD